MGAKPRIWVLLGHRAGDNNQLLALAEALGLPFETRTLHFNPLRVLHRILGSSLASLRRDSGRRLGRPWPDLVLGIGWRSVPAARWIRRQNGGRTKLVRLGNPRADAALFDLIVTTPQYAVPDAPNVLRLPLGMSRYKDPPAAEPDEADFLDGLARPRLLLAVGGPAKYWALSPQASADAARRLAQRAADRGGSLVAVTSPRTPANVASAVSKAVSGQAHCRIVQGRRPRFGVLLAAADEIFVTGDSVAMLSEAVLSGRPVGVVPIEPTAFGRRALADDGALRRRDLRKFWQRLRDQGLAGTIEEPVAGKVADPTATAADAVRALLRDRVE